MVSGYDVNFVDAKICKKDKRLKKTFSEKQQECMEAGVDKKTKCFVSKESNLPNPISYVP